MDNDGNENGQKTQTNQIDMNSIQRAALGVRAALSDLGDYIVQKAREILDDNGWSSAISGGIDAKTGKRLKEMGALKNIGLQDKFGNIIFQTKKVTTGGKIANFADKNSPIGTSLTTLYSLYKDVTKYSGTDLMLATTLTGLSTVAGLQTGNYFTSQGFTTRAVFVSGGVAGTIAGNVTDRVKDYFCIDRTKYGNTDIRKPTDQT